MKKQILTLIAIAFTTLAFAQNFKEDPNFIKQAPNAKGYMIDTVSSSVFNKEQLYSNTLAFLTNNFKDSRSVVEAKDLELGEISFKGNTSKQISVSDTAKKGKISSYDLTVKLFFKCKVYLKDKKFKIVLHNLETGMPFSNGVGLPLDPFDNNTFIKENKAASEQALELIKSISSFLNTKPANDF